MSKIIIVGGVSGLSAGIYAGVNDMKLLFMKGIFELEGISQDGIEKDITLITVFKSITR